VNILCFAGGLLVGYGIWWFRNWLMWRSATVIEGTFDPPIVIPAGESVSFGIKFAVEEEGKEDSA